MRRRDIVRERLVAGEARQVRTVREAVSRAIAMETAIESALKGGFCPSCGKRIGRGVREHFESCEGAASEPRKHGPAHTD